ncbi:MAG: XdhC family protein [Pseudomonadota bacterium]
MDLLHDQIPETALSWHQSGKGAALATVVETWGSAPRPTGAQLAISGDADLMGSVSGGCVEGAVVAEAMEAVEGGTSRILTYGVSDSDAFAVGLTCGGTIRVMVEPVGGAQGISAEMLRQVCAARAARSAVGVVTDTAQWTRNLLQFADAPDLFGAGVSGFLQHDAQFTWLSNPPLRLAIVGGAHIAQPLTQMARLTGYDVTVIDPREAFASEARFPGVPLMVEWPDAALASHGLDHRTALVTLTHDPKLDDPAIITALKSDAFYIGCLGSTRTHAKRVTRLLEAGFTEAEIARIDAPIGLDIGSKSPAEIAVSVMGELTERLRRPETRPGVHMPEAAA